MTFVTTAGIRADKARLENRWAHYFLPAFPRYSGNRP
jgi:hypothetical protein